MSRRSISRRSFLTGTAAALAVPVWRLDGGVREDARADEPGAGPRRNPAPPKIRFGLVTYQWAKDWDLPTLIANCEKSRVLGVELRTTHRHGVEPALDERARKEVKKRFADSAVELVGLGSDERFDHVDPEAVKKAIAATQDFIRLSHDVGGSGVKVKPDSFHKGVPREKTIEQIGKALAQVARHGEGFGQEIRLEVHGECRKLPVIEKIVAVADHPNLRVCWNSNATDLEGGLAKNFTLVAKRLGKTLHVHDLKRKDYPYGELVELLVRGGWDGWAMLEEGEAAPQDAVAALDEQREIFAGLIAAAERRAGAKG